MLRSSAETGSAVEVEHVSDLLSIDEDTAYVTIPEPGAAGGALCPNTF